MRSFLLKLFCTVAYLLGGTVIDKNMFFPRTLSILSFTFFIYFLLKLVYVKYF